MVVKGRYTAAFGVMFFLVVALCFVLLRANQAPVLRRWVEGSTKTAALVRRLSEITLEVYLVHLWAPEKWPIAQLPRPLNFLIFWCAAIALAWGLEQCARPIRARLVQPATVRPPAPAA
jgi:hypothetical protein